uniref:Uncharacterized protein n=1 Tax=Avena sativa TaxID=4498 RepID=A0ACD5YG10_AVESA
MAAFVLKASLPGACFTAAGLSGGQNPPPNSRFSDQRSSAVPSMAWSMGSGRRDTTPKPHAAKWVLQNDDYLYDAQALHIDTQFSPAAEYIDLLNRTCYRDPVLGRTKLAVTDQRKGRQEAREKRSRELVDGLVEYISSDNENYKYAIIASKENANMIMQEGFISSNARDEILDGLERIEKDIEEGKFQWRNNKDIRTNIIEALIDQVEGPAKRLDEVTSHYDQMLTILNLWCNDSIDKFVSRIKELQVELVLLAIRNEGLVVPCSNRYAGCILLGDMVLSKVEQLENDVSRLVSCKIKMDSTRLTPFSSGSTDNFMNSLSNGGLHHVHNSIMDFGNLIVGDIAHDLTDLENDLHTQLVCSLTRNDEVTKSIHLMWRHKIDLETFHVMGHAGSIYNASADSSKRFLKAYRVVPEMIKAATEFTRNSSFDPEKFLSFPPGFVGNPELAGFDPKIITFF